MVPDGWISTHGLGPVGGNRPADLFLIELGDVGMIS